MVIQIEHLDVNGRKMQQDALRTSFHLPAPADHRDSPHLPVSLTA